MAFKTGNSKFDSLLRRARSKRLSADALSQNNIDVETISENIENQENNEDNNDRESVSDISGLGSSGVGSTGVWQGQAAGNLQDKWLLIWKNKEG